MPVLVLSPEDLAKNDRRGQILAASLRLFSTHGFAATSIQKIAAEVGMSKQALMHHFPTKNRLHDALMQQLAKQWTSFFPTFLAEIHSKEYDRYRVLVERIGDHFKNNAEASRFIARELLDRPEATIQWLIKHGTPWLNAVNQLKPTTTSSHSEKQNKDQIIDKENPSNNAINKNITPSKQDLEAHLIVLGGIQLAISAFVFSNPELAKTHKLLHWQERLLEASKHIIRRGSNIDPDQEAES